MIALLLALQITAVDPHQLALDQYKKHDYAAAVAAFQHTLEIEKSGTPAYQESVLLLAQSLFLTHRAPEAIPYLEKAEVSGEVLYMLGSAHLINHDATKANVSFAAMYGVHPASAAAHLITAQMMMRQELVDDAQKEVQRALELNPKLPQAHYLLGEIQMFRGAADLAIAAFKDEIAINPDSSTAYYKLGDAYSRRSDWTSAIASLQKSVWLNPDYSGPYILLGKGYLKLDQAKNAEGVLRHAIQLDPRNYSAHYLLGQSLIQQGRTDEGRQMLDESLKLKH